MLLAGLIDLGANYQGIRDELKSISNFVPDFLDFKMDCKKVLKNGITATQIHFSFKEKDHHNHGEDLQLIMKTITSHLNWNDPEKNLAFNILNTLIQTEAKIHGTSPDHVQLHEAGSMDTIADILGFIMACKDLQLLENCSWISTPVAVGGGILKFSHGLTSNPAPATLEILKNNNFEIVGGPVESELTTPTGASILVNLVKNTTKFYPSIVPLKIGYGAGTKDFPNVPNILRIIYGNQPVPIPYNFEQIVTIETNIDDITGELLGNTINKLVDTGFLKDISVIPVSSRKRPGYLIQILTNYEHLFPITQLLITELGTLGVRFFPTMRYTLNRKMISLPIEILNQNYKISVKISWDLNNILIQTKPESDEIEQLSKKTGVPMRKLLQLINEKLEKTFPLGQKMNDLPEN